MANPYIFTIPGRPFLLQAESLREEFRRVLGTPGETISVERIFKFIELTDNNETLQEDLIRRGAFTRDAGDVFRNVGRTIDTVARDVGPDLPSLGLYIPRRLNVSASFIQGVFLLLPVEGTRIIVTFERPPIPGVGQRFVLDRIEGTNARWVYSFHDDSDSSAEVHIVVDMTLAAETRVLRRYDPSKGRRLTLARRTVSDLRFASFGDCICHCCEGFRARRHPCPPMNQPLTLNLRVIVLLDATEPYNFQADVDRQIQAMTDLYRQQRITINIMGPDILRDPARLIVVPGDCFFGQPSPDIVGLHDAYAGNIQPNEIACFVVRQIVGFGGCAAHPDGRPGFVMDRTIGDPRDSVMGHELGHVLSLLHVPDRRNLMWGDDNTVIVDAPPDLYPDQIVAIRCYPPPWLT